MTLMEKIEEARKQFMAKQEEENLGTLEGLKDAMKKNNKNYIQPSTDTYRSK